MIYKDNAAAIMMADTSKPNGHTCNININYFALQDWGQCTVASTANMQAIQDVFFVHMISCTIL
eukprot:11198490-Ditylum_brightwellii.AAC.1